MAIGLLATSDSVKPRKALAASSVLGPAVALKIADLANRLRVEQLQKTQTQDSMNEWRSDCAGSAVATVRVS